MAITRSETIVTIHKVTEAYSTEVLLHKEGTVVAPTPRFHFYNFLATWWKDPELRSDFQTDLLEPKAGAAAIFKQIGLLPGHGGTFNPDLLVKMLGSFSKHYMVQNEYHFKTSTHSETLDMSILHRFILDCRRPSLSGDDPLTALRNLLSSEGSAASSIAEMYTPCPKLDEGETASQSTLEQYSGKLSPINVLACWIQSLTLKLNQPEEVDDIDTIIITALPQLLLDVAAMAVSRQAVCISG